MSVGIVVGQFLRCYTDGSEGAEMDQGNARFALWLVLLMTLMEGAQAKCTDWVTQAVSLQGTIEVRRADQREWLPSKLNDRYCAGDIIRSSEHSRAALMLRNGTLLRMDQRTALVLPSLEQEPAWLKLIQGAIQLISNTAYRLNVQTPFLNAGMEGTEFVVRVSDSDARVWVVEGVVLVSNRHGRIRLREGKAAFAQAQRTPQPYLKINARDASAWALYYPPIIDFRNQVIPDPERRRANALFRKGDLSAAISVLDSIPDRSRSSEFFIQRAGFLLTVGEVGLALKDIHQASRLSPEDGAPFALRSIITLIRGEKEEAVSLAKKGLRLRPDSPLPWTALSYAKQASFDIEGARADIKKALEIAPSDPLAWARLAELYLSIGALDEALEAAQKAEELDPELAHTQAVLGFAQLLRIDTRRAKATFGKAIELDPSAPLPRLGLGLARIREGDMEQGTRDIEVAAILDPENSLVRSYLGKAYYEKRQGHFASREFSIAKQLDAKDPTPWFYDAIYKQTVNQPVEALRDLQKSIELNDNRIVYRSRLLLDQDLAARSSALGRIYQNLNFGKLGLLESWKSVNKDPTNFSAHQLLSLSFADLPGHEIAQASELLQAQLLQPINITPRQLQVFQPKFVSFARNESGAFDLSIQSAVGPSSPSANEFNPLFNSNRVALQASGSAGTGNTWGDNLILSGVIDQLSLSASQSHFENAGLGRNDSLRQNAYGFFAQAALSPELSVQAELNYEEILSGDLRSFQITRDFMKESRRDLARVGAHYSTGPQQDLILTASYENKRLSTRDRNFFSFNAADVTKNYQVEVQHLFSSSLFKTIAGGSYLRSTRHHEVRINIPDFFVLPSFSSQTQNQAFAVYLYSFLNPIPSLTVILGCSYDYFSGPTSNAFNTDGNNKSQFNPKIGLLWNPFPSTTIRLAALRGLKRPYSGSQTIEPTQIAGFSQFFDESDGSDYRRYGIGLDQKLGVDIYAGLEATWRKVKLPRPFGPFDVGNKTEQLHRAYLYWTPSSLVSMGLEYQYEFQNNNPNDPTRLKTHIVPFSLNYFDPSGVFASVGGTYVNQSGRNRFVNPNQNSTTSDQFWVFDASIGYRFPKRLGLFNLSVFNLFDQSFRFQDSNSDPQRLPRFRPERTILATLRFSF